MKYPKCEQKERQYKHGETKADSQRYHCQNCGYSQVFRQKAIKMYVDGSDLRQTGSRLSAIKGRSYPLYDSNDLNVYASLWYHWGRYAVSDGNTDTYSVEGNNAEL